tara:strand:- start:445 stop:678 length:234 start_codon:yes stop_codon:yes gene_type:complete
MSLSQQFLDKEDKKSNVPLGNYSQLRVDIFKIIYSTCDMSEKRAELFTEDILELVDNHITEMLCPPPIHQGENNNGK